MTHIFQTSTKLSDMIDANFRLLRVLTRIGVDQLRARCLTLIYHLEDDLHYHTTVENGVLVPMTKRMEENQSFPADLRPSSRTRAVSTSAQPRSGPCHTRPHRKNITHKTGIKTVAGLTVYALLNNLLDINSVE